LEIETEAGTMIQIQNRQQFEKAAGRLTNERMSIRKAEAHAYKVRNVSKGTEYTVRFTQRNGSTFVSCDCPAGIRHGKAPLVCKHVAAAILFVRAIRNAREMADAYAAGDAYDGDD
jgi:uncharacterized Zn finger protein